MRQRHDRGYAMAALLVAMSVMAVLISVALPSWRTLAKREREAELVFRGQQYARAVTLFQRKFAGAYPPNLDILLTQKFLRKKYKDPITNDDFQLVAVGDPRAAGGPAPQAGRGAPPGAAGQPAGQPAGRGQVPQQQGGIAGRIGGAPGIAGAGAGIQGVVSKSTEESLRLFNNRNHYNEWVFIAAAATTQAGAPGGAQNPGPQQPIGTPGMQGPGRQGFPQPPGARGAPPPGGRAAPPFDGRMGFPGRGQGR